MLILPCVSSVIKEELIKKINIIKSDQMNHKRIVASSVKIMSFLSAHFSSPSNAVHSCDILFSPYGSMWRMAESQWMDDM